MKQIQRIFIQIFFSVLLFSQQSCSENKPVLGVTPGADKSKNNSREHSSSFGTSKVEHKEKNRLLSTEIKEDLNR